MEIEVSRRSGSDVLPFLDDAARLRISVFREFPYLYQGETRYEVDYLRFYADCPTSVFVVAQAGDEIIGVSTGLPLKDADEGFRKPFEDLGMETGEWFYFGESVLAPEWRGQGIGHRFFEEREAHARSLGFRHATFCSVVRSEDHPLRPVGYHTHDVFWTKRGFVKDERLVARLDWPQVDSNNDEVINELVFWIKELHSDFQ